MQYGMNLVHNAKYIYKYWLAYLMYLRDLGPQTPRRLTYHQPVKHLPPLMTCDVRPVLR